VNDYDQFDWLVVVAALFVLLFVFAWVFGWFSL
jgi:hypothetical protein